MFLWCDAIKTGGTVLVSLLENGIQAKDRQGQRSRRPERHLLDIPFMEKE